MQQEFGQKPKGLWLTERIWDSSIVPALVRCGVEYAIVDDYHFVTAGFPQTDMDGFYYTEEGGYGLKLFPISEKLRYTIPFQSPVKSVEYLLSHARADGTGAMTFFDDGEKFGVWPKTYDWVYGKRRWLDEFLQTITSLSDLRTVHFGEYADKNISRGIAYLPVCSYYEMGAWTLPSHLASQYDDWYHDVQKEDAAKAAHFLKGSIWKNFLVKYPESNNLHKKMLRLSTMVRGLEAREALYQGQCNDVLWHGVFGGLYLPNLRFNAYEALNRCEHLAGRPGITISDYNYDGCNEVLARTSDYFAVISPRDGGQLLELSSMSSYVNYLNTISRKHEAYHDKLNQEPCEQEVQAEDDESSIATIHDAVMDVETIDLPPRYYDWHSKYSFIDHFTAAPPHVENFAAADMGEQGDFANQPFDLISHSSTDALVRRKGGLFLWDKQLAAITLEKRFHFLRHALIVDVFIEADQDVFVHYGCELNIHVPSSPEESWLNCDGHKLAKDHRHSYEGVRRCSVHDPLFHAPLTLDACTPQQLLVAPVVTVSQSEGGFDTTYQGTSLLWCQPLQLQRGERTKVSFMVTLKGGESDNQNTP
ncbi:hypothetical protein HNR37_001943 [Desulfurispira natronophila]|uniref:4-alpha-glucanotransferase n=1 Tax=Desulfurispira natronophila TaxID=682562 RepID=A0A7W8DHL0_9BACT|nr:hypothetical protein [Desulfurispira natronophila]